MESIDQEHAAVGDVDEMSAFVSAAHLAELYAIPMTLKAVIELGVLDAIGNAGPGCQLSPAEIASRISAGSPQAPVVLDRMLRNLASNSVLTCSVVSTELAGSCSVERRYGISPVGKFFLSNSHGASLAPMILMNQDKIRQDSWQHLKYAVLDGVIPFRKAHGMSMFAYLEKDPTFSSLFNNAMSSCSSLLLKMILESYTGFEGIGKLVDVAGGVGTALRIIVTKFPHIKGINFDQPHVVSDAPPIPGVEHIGGDMFASIPSADAIFMKWILHNWSDEHCLKILKNCLKALPNSGKMIIVEFIIPTVPQEDPMTQNMLYGDLCMLNYTEGGKERTEKEYESLAKEAGFSEFKVVTCANGIPVIEFIK